MRKSPDLASKIMALHGHIKEVARLGLKLKTPTAGGGAVGVVEYDRQLGGGVPSVKSEKRWEEECAVSEYLSL